MTGDIEDVSVMVGNMDHPLPTEEDLKVDNFFEKQLLASSGFTLNRVAVEALHPQDGGSLTFKQLNGTSNTLARKLVAMLLPFPEKTPLVAVRFDPDVSLIVSLLAILKAGMAYLPISSDWPETRVKQILLDAKPFALLTNRTDLEYDQDAAAASINILHFDKLISYMGTAENSEPNLGPDEKVSVHYREELLGGDDTFAIMYTSGSSGSPKGVRLRHQSVLQRIHWQWRLLPYNSVEDVCAFKAALTFIDAVTEVFSALLSLHKLIVFPVQDVKDVSRFVKGCAEAGVCRLYLIPTLMQNMLSHMAETGETLPKLQRWESTGEPLTLEVAEAFFQAFPDGSRSLCNIFGGTEMMDNIFAEFRSLDDLKESCLVEEDTVRLPIGKVVDNATILIMEGSQAGDPSMVPVKMGDVGEICVSGICLAGGYIGNNSSKSSEVFIKSGSQRIYRTGDYGKMVKGLIYYEGRKDTQVKIRGQRLNLADIEQVAARSDLVRICRVLAISVQADLKLVAFCIPWAPSTKSKAIKDHLAAYLPGFMIPRVVCLPELPFLVNGKVDRQALIAGYLAQCSQQILYLDTELAPYLGGSDVAGGEEALQIAQTVLESVRSVIGIGAEWEERLCLGDNFFDIGGTSLNALTAVAKVNDCLKADFRCPLMAEQFLAADTLADVVEAIVSNQVNKTAVKTLNNKIKVEPMEKWSQLKDEIIRQQSSAINGRTALTNHVYSRGSEEAFFKFSECCWTGAHAPYSLVAIDPDEEGHLQYLGHIFCIDLHMDPVGPLVEALTATFPETPSTRASLEILHFVSTIVASEADKVYPAEDWPSGGGVMETFFLAVNENLHPSTKVVVAKALETEAIQMAKSAGFKAIITLNTSPLTQQLSLELGYRTLAKVQINAYVSPLSERRIFPEASDDVIVTVNALDLID